jgi:hypothetical protein
VRAVNTHERDLYCGCTEGKEQAPKQSQVLALSIVCYSILCVIQCYSNNTDNRKDDLIQL